MLCGARWGGYQLCAFLSDPDTRLLVSAENVGFCRHSPINYAVSSPFSEYTKQNVPFSLVDTEYWCSVDMFCCSWWCSVLFGQWDLGYAPWYRKSTIRLLTERTCSFPVPALTYRLVFDPWDCRKLRLSKLIFCSREPWSIWNTEGIR